MTTSTKIRSTSHIQESCYSPLVSRPREYNPNRHIPLSAAYDLIRDQQDSHLQPKALEQAVAKGQIHIYSFKGEQFLDRFDVGRVFYRPPAKKRGLTVERHFSKGTNKPLEAVKYERRHLTITNWVDKKVIFEMTDALFPENWDDNEASIVAQKYLYKPHDPEKRQRLEAVIGSPYERSPAHLISRTTDFFVSEGKRLGYFATQRDEDNFRSELEALQIQRKFAFNSPVQFNAGLYSLYGITGQPRLNFWRDSRTGKVIQVRKGEYVHPQSHACFILGPEDNLEAILQHFVDEGSIFHHGSGVGQNIGLLREEGAQLSGGGKASGPISFLKTYDRGAGSIKSGGKSRRAARMTTMNSSHPDVMEFISLKPDEEKKVYLLQLEGYSGGMDGEAATTAAMQNTNLSVRMTSEDFEKVRNGGDIKLISVANGQVVGQVSARDMLRRIAYGTWRCGDPAVQYETEIHRMHPCKNSGRQESSNPCSEYLFLTDTSCNLGSLNVAAFSDDRGRLNVLDWVRAARVASIALDIANDASSYPVDRIAAISPEFRTIGLGYAGVGSWLMRRGVPYASEEAHSLVGALTASMTGASYLASTELADRLGPFVHFAFNKNPMLEVIQQHRKNLDSIVLDNSKEDHKELVDMARTIWDETLKRGERHGFRNAQATVIAPTGTISYLLGTSDSTGIEPAIALTIHKELAGGGTLTLANKNVGGALVNLGYSSREIGDINSFIEKSGTIRGAPHVKPDHYPVFDTAFGNKDGVGAIPLDGHVRMLAAAQPFVSGAISKTCNLPEQATVKEIYDSYLLGEQLKLKALAMFRNNSKATSALNFGVHEQHQVLERGEKFDLPPQRRAFETEVEIGGKPLHVIVSEYEDGRPGQVTLLSFKSGSDIGAILSTSGIQASRALKRGVDAGEIADGWIGHEFEPKGLVKGHPHIHMARSALDFVGKLIKLEYYGDTTVTEDPDTVDLRNLRGFKNGAFRTYARQDIDPWGYDDVINDSEFGGFVEEKEGSLLTLLQERQLKNGHKLNNDRGVTCPECRRMMRQTASNCYSCENCGNKLGGCGL